MFPCIYSDDHVLLHYSTNIVNYIDWFSDVKPILHPGIKPHLAKVDYPVDILLDFIC